MADKPFRVLLDLTDLHIECLKYVWMNVSPQELTTVADFKTSVIRKINLDKVDIKLFVQNGLLLDDETIMVLRENDTVKVHYISQHKSGYSHAENCVKERNKSSRKRDHSESPSDSSLNTKKYKRGNEILPHINEAHPVIETSKKKKKHKQPPSSCSESLYNQSNTFEIRNYDTVNFHDKDEKQTTLQKNITDLNLMQKSEQFLSFDNQDSSKTKNKNKVFKTNINAGSNSCLNLDSAKDSLLFSNFSSELDNGIEKTDINTEAIKKSGGVTNNCPKKKRKRRKKRKQDLETVVIDAFDKTEENREFKSFTNEALQSVQRKHIIYSCSPSKKEEVVQLHCDSKNEVKDLTVDTFVLNEGVSNVNVKSSKNYPKISTPAQSDFCKNPNWCLSLMQQTDLQSYHNETIGFEKGKNRNYTHTKSIEKQSISFDNPENNKKSPEFCYTNLPPLNFRPDVGAHIAYKILELDEHYSPIISHYREGIVKNINLDNEEMEIELLKHEIKPGRTGKFENLKNDEIPLPEIKTCDVVRWSAMVEPKLIVDTHA